MRTLAVPTGRVARLLYGLCRRGPAPEPARSLDGWDVYVIEGLDGGSFQLALPASPDDDGLGDLAMAALNRGVTDDGAIVELAVVLALLLELNGISGLWRWQRVIEILHGSGARPERHNDPIRQLLALFQVARVSFDDRCSTAPQTWAQLVVLDRNTRSSATVRLDPAFHRELVDVTYAVPAASLRIGPPTVQPDPKKPDVVKRVANPEGNLPSRRARARARVGLMLKIAPRRRGEKPKTQLATELEQLMVDAGGDIDRVKRRRHLQPWGLALKDELETAGKALGVGLVWFREQVGSILRTVFNIGRPPAEEGRPPAEEGRPPAEEGPATPRGSRGPP